MSKHILVIDPSRTIRLLLSLYFKNANHHVITCVTPGDALQVLAHLGSAPLPEMIFLAIDRDKAAYSVIEYAKEHPAYMYTCVVAMVLEEEKMVIQRELKNISFPVYYLVKPFHIQDAVLLVSAPLPRDAASPGTLIQEKEGKR